VEEMRYSFNDSGNITQLNDYAGYSAKNSGLAVKEYNEHGDIIRQEEYTGDGQIFQTKQYKYDSKNNNSEIDGMDNHGKLFLKEFFKYDNYGNNVEDIHCDERDSIQWRIGKIYDEQDNLVERDTYRKKSSAIEERSTYKYDNKGNMIQYREYSNGGKFERESDREYDSKNKLISIKEYNDKLVLSGRAEFTNDSAGNAIKELYYESAGKEPSITYIREYDKNGNCIKFMEIRNGKGITIVYRIIEYDK